MWVYVGAANYGRGAQYNNYAGYASGYPSHYHTQAAAQQQYGYGEWTTVTSESVCQYNEE